MLFWSAIKTVFMKCNQNCFYESQSYAIIWIPYQMLLWMLNKKLLIMNHNKMQLFIAIYCIYELQINAIMNRNQMLLWMSHKKILWIAIKCFYELHSNAIYESQSNAIMNHFSQTLLWITIKCYYESLFTNI